MQKEKTHESLSKAPHWLFHVCTQGLMNEWLKTQRPSQQDATKSQQTNPNTPGAPNLNEFRKTKLKGNPSDHFKVTNSS